MSTVSNWPARVCPGCDIVAALTECRVCGITAYGNGRECWPCHDANSHARSGPHPKYARRQSPRVTR